MEEGWGGRCDVCDVCAVQVSVWCTQVVVRGVAISQSADAVLWQERYIHVLRGVRRVR